MKLIDRPGFDHELSGHRGLSATASAALHAAVLLTFFSVLRLSSGSELAVPVTALLPQHLVWMPHEAGGGGRDGGGERAPEPARRARAIGTDAISVATVQQQPSIDATLQPPDEISTIPAMPMGDATQTLAGAVESNGTSAGPGNTGVGTADGNHRGALGDQPADGFGPGASRGGPGVTMPTLVERVAPKYTVDAMRARIQGSVWIECVVLPDGSVGDARIMRSLDRRFGLDEEAIAAAKRWRFRPGLLNGKAVPVVVTIELMFSVR